MRPTQPLPALKLQPSTGLDSAGPLRENDRVWAVGFPLGENLERELAAFKLSRNANGPNVSIREGTVTALREDGDRLLKAIEHGCKIEHGNSGGPLVDRFGRVVGINFAGMGRATSFAIPADTALAQFPETLAWIARGKGGRRTLQLGRGYSTLEQALAAAQPGDVIDLPVGEHPIPQRLAVPDGVWLRGAGVGKTILLGAEGRRSVVTIGQGEYTEADQFRDKALRTMTPDTRVAPRAGTSRSPTSPSAVAPGTTAGTPIVLWYSASGRKPGQKPTCTISKLTPASTRSSWSTALPRPTSSPPRSTTAGRV